MGCLRVDTLLSDKNSTIDLHITTDMTYDRNKALNSK